MKALEIRLATLGPQHHDTASSYSNLGNACYNKGEYDKAVEHHMKAHEIQLTTLGPQHPKTKENEDNLAKSRKACL